MKFGSVCSGIEAASVAWHPLGWTTEFVSEIEPFPSAVLAHHYPNTPNYGDMTNFEDWPDATLDVLVGGTPCQSFSVAGLRKGLDDPRGNLMLTFGAIARRYRPTWLVWENVPGVLSSNGGRDFGTFLGMLGELGYGFSYRVLDAQYFGVAQRRRRVFVVGCLGNWRRAAAVLFERDSLSGNPPPSRKTREVAPTIPSRSTGGGGLGTDFDCDGGLIARAVSLRGREGGGTAELGDDVQSCLRASGGGGDKPHVLIHADPIARCEEFQPSAQIAQRIKVDERGCWVWQNRLTRHGYGQICVSGKFYQAHRYSYAQSKGEIAAGMTIDHLCKNRACVNPAHLEAVDFKTNNMRSDSVSAVNSRKTHCNNGHAFDEANTGYRNGTHERYCRACKREEARRRSGMGEVIADEIVKCITAGEAKRQDWETCNFVAFHPTQDPISSTDGTTHCIGTGNSHGGATVAVAFDTTQITSAANYSSPKPGDPCHPLSAGAHAPAIATKAQVRRLTPIECERLQGFPDEYTRIPWKAGYWSAEKHAPELRAAIAEQCPDGPRYKALGNSMAVPVMRWIGERIQEVAA